MKRALFTTLVLTAIVSTPLSAQEANVFRNPCERGPWPNVAIINDSRTSFVLFLQEVRPTMPINIAHQIASRLCDDMSMVGDSAGLSKRLNSLLREYGY